MAEVNLSEHPRQITDPSLRDAEFRAYFPASDYDKNAEIIGREYALTGSTDARYHNPNGGKSVDYDHYVEIEHRISRQIASSPDQVPRGAREYFNSLPEFGAFVKAVTPGERKATFSEFASVHDRFARQRFELYLKKFETYKEDYGARLRQLVEDGDLPKVALSNLGNLDTLGLNVSDRPWLHGGGLGFSAWFEPFAHQVTLGLFIPDEKLREIVFHELTHAISGRNATKGGRVTRSGLPGNAARSLRLNEAITEHVSQVMQHGQPEVINPSEREVRSRHYYFERSATAKLVRNGDLPLKHILDAYFTNLTPGDDSYVQVVRNLVEEWPSRKDDLKKIDKNANRWDRINNLADSVIGKVIEGGKRPAVRKTAVALGSLTTALVVSRHYAKKKKDTK